MNSGDNPDAHTGRHGISASKIIGVLVLLILGYLAYQSWTPGFSGERSVTVCTSMSGNCSQAKAKSNGLKITEVYVDLSGWPMPKPSTRAIKFNQDGLCGGGVCVGKLDYTTVGQGVNSVVVDGAFLVVHP
jgi:hypothetical protein